MANAMAGKASDLDLVAILKTAMSKWNHIGWVICFSDKVLFGILKGFHLNTSIRYIFFNNNFVSLRFQYVDLLEMSFLF